MYNQYYLLLNNTQSGYELMNLVIRRLVICPMAAKLLITDMVIKAIEQMAAEQGIKLLKL